MEPGHAECEEIDEVNPVGELLRFDDIQLDVELPDKPRALRHIATMLARRVGLPDSEVLDGLAAREQLGSTGLGQGVAIPHARLTRCNAAAAVLVRPNIGIPLNFRCCKANASLCMRSERNVTLGFMVG